MPFLKRVNRVLAGFGLQLQTLGANPVGALVKPEDQVVALRAEWQALRRDLLRHQIICRWSAVDALAESSGSLPNPMRCPLCQHQGAASSFVQLQSHCLFGGGKLIRHQCPACDLIFGPLKMLDLSAAALAEDYQWHYQAYEEGDSTEYERRAFFSMQPRRNGLYLNYGAGCWSHTVRQLREEGWQVYSYDPHVSPSSSSRETWQLQEQELASMRFDGIFTNNVLEHFRFPVSELQRMAQLLVANGCMAHATPCYEYLYEYTRFHLFFYPGRSVARLLELADLQSFARIDDGDFKCLTMRPRSA